MAYFLQRKYLQKPRQWGPASSVRFAISNWFDRLGVDPASVNGAIGWDGWLHYIRPENHIIPTNHVWSDTLQAFDISSADPIAIHTSSVELRLVFCKFNLTTAAVSASSTTHGIVQVADATNVADANTFMAAGSVTSYLTGETITVYGGTLSTRTGITSAIGIGPHTLSARYDGSTKYQLSLDSQVHGNIDGSQGAADLKTGPLYFNGRLFSSNPRFCPEIVLVISSQCDAAVAMRLHDDPYGMIQPRAMPIYSFASATAGATYQLTADGGSYAVLGSDAGLLRSARLEASGGILSISGTAASLLFSHMIASDSGSFVISGSDTELFSNRYLLADSVAFSISGSDADLLRNALVSAGAGSFTLTGSDVTLTYTPVGAYILSANGGSFVLTGSDATLLRDLSLTADGGSFSISGSAAGLVFDRVLSAAGGSYALTGSDATLAYTPSGAYILTCEAGSFALSGSGVDLLRDYIMPVYPGSYALSGADAGLLLSRMLAASGGAFTLTGADAEFLRNYNLNCDGGTYTLTGSDVTLTYSGYELPSGKMSITFAIKQPGVLFSQKTPGITFTVN